MSCTNPWAKIKKAGILFVPQRVKCSMCNKWRIINIATIKIENWIQPKDWKCDNNDCSAPQILSDELKLKYNALQLCALKIQRYNRWKRRERGIIVIEGYIKQHMMENNNYIYPSSLNGVIFDFSGNIMLRFDIITNDYKHIIEENGTIIRRNKSMNIRICMIGCSCGINEGVGMFKIKCIEPWRDCIGIISNINECKHKEMWIGAASGYKYWWYGNSSIFAQFGHKNLWRRQIGIEWKRGDVIMVKINCNEWKIHFLLNDKLITNEISIEPNLKYYPVICTQSQTSIYQLLY